jgi:hypothetical protein
VAGTTLRKLASGSPMPMNTTLVISRSPPGRKPSSRFASHTWPTISAVLRLRLKPCAPVEQNEQSSAQPTCEEMHSVPRPGSGMNTISIACEASARSSHLRVPSLERCAVTISGRRTSACSVNSARNDLARSLIAANSPTPRLYSQFISWRARNACEPRPATKPSSCARGS